MSASTTAASDPTTRHPGVAEVLLDALFENSTDAVVTLDVDGTIRHVTSNTSLLLGHDRHTAIGRSVFDYLHPDDVAAVADLFERRLDFIGRDMGTTLRVVDAHGAIVKVHATAAVLPPSAAELEIGACVITLRTLDETSEREHALHRRIVVTEYVNRLGSDLLAAPDPDAVFARIDQSMAELGLLTGASGVCIVGESAPSGDRSTETLSAWTHDERGVDSGWPEADQTASELLLARPIVTNDISSDRELVDCLPVSLDGVVSTPFTANGRRCALVLVRNDGVNWWESDVELARAVGRLLARAIQTAWSERLLSLTYRRAPVAFCLHNWNGDLVDCNDRYVDLLGTDRASGQGRTIAAALHDSAQSTWQRLVAQLRSGATDRIEVDLQMRLEDRTEIWIRCHGVRLEVPGSCEGMLLTSCADITASRQQRLQLEYAANHDSLTGVANRSALWTQLDAGAAKANLPTMLVIDLDRFKLVNDGHGHAIGDSVLQVVARRLQHSVRHGDLVARLGGDEFAIALPNTTAAEAADIAERIIETVRAPIQVGELRFVQTVSIGIASGADAGDPAELMVCADRALYEAKHRGRCQRVVFSPTEEPAALVDVKLERELRAALDRDEFEIYFQPEFRISDGAMVGAEALLRWRHPTRGLVPAAEFIEVAERTGAIDDLGRYALRHATETFAEACRRAGTDELVLRVNLSAREFARPELNDITRSALERSGLAPHQLCLEMTETTLMDAPDIAIATLESLRHLGVRFAIDDFGIGNSSLAHLKRFPVDVLKIDRTFVHDIDRDDESAAIVRSIVQLARAMSLEVVAEGVEAPTQLAALADTGCDRAQGYLFAPPVPIDELIATFTTTDRDLAAAVA